MARRRKRKLLVPEARAALDSLKSQVVQEQVQSGNQSPNRRSESTDPARLVARSIGVSYNEKDNGDMTARQAGEIGGNIGGPMVQKLIAIAQRELAGKDNRANP